jgi:hypothetical protein
LTKLFAAAAAVFLLCPLAARAATPWEGSTNINSGDRIVTLAQREAVLTDAFAGADRTIVMLRVAAPAPGFLQCTLVARQAPDGAEVELASIVAQYYEPAKVTKQLYQHQIRPDSSVVLFWWALKANNAPGAESCQTNYRLTQLPGLGNF